MKYIEKKIKEHQYLSDIMKQLARNCIYQKPTGRGITHLEICTDRDSVIVETNKPVIQGKCSEFNKGNRRKLKIRGVYEGVTVQDIIDYLQSDVEYKKIITTPESYFKVVEAIVVLEMEKEFYSKYFFLFDECEHTIQDVDFREYITYPIDDFFKFKNKAFVSATPIVPSDSRFEMQKFKFVNIIPDYNHVQDLNLIVTNNCLLSLNEYLKRNKRKQYFIFLNSTKAIITAINFLGVSLDDSYIFCSEESRNKLKLNKITNAESTLVKSEHFRQFNFFTSRFNSAVDILNVTDPEIVIISDLFLAQHSMVDPFSEVIQIVGRFRKPKDGAIKRYITHITNIDENLGALSEKELIEDIERLKSVHDTLTSFLQASTTSFARTIVNEMLLTTTFAKFVNANGKTKPFMIDNAKFRNKVKHYYQKKELLLQAYQNTKMFNTNLLTEEYKLTDEIRLQIKESKNALKTSMELLLPILSQLEAEGIDKLEVQDQLNQIKQEHPTTYGAFKTIGFERAKELHFSYSLIQREIGRVKTLNEGNNFKFLSDIKTRFTVFQKYTLKQIKTKLKSLMKENNLTRLTPGIELLEKYFEVSAREYIGSENGKPIYGYTILGVKI
ncbi:DEAD/DEAH box helicase family protein [Pedobacter endophyticus]|uniref:DEAD/DEAH box helicase family protein n=1 Tax=Pedobacter endophyticus TaxID=2789740 RepID=A0A7U3Q570_9SPHI|nr:DEAD/DEAH box helicase family protein [Pedobacter endophyticus]QPH37895.1 DEAD/DEAH box helicase family protein [Pedobacter endophyticus]